MAEKFDLSVILRLKDQATGKLTKFGTAAQKTGKAMAAFGKTAALAGAAATVAFGVAAIKKTAQFQGTMNMVGAVTKSTTAEFQQLNTVAKQLGATTQFSANDAANAMKFMGMAGLRTNKIIAAAPKVLQLAAAAQLDMGTSADIVTNIMAGFGDAAGGLAKVNDVLVNAFTGSNVNLQGLGEGMKKAGPVASKLGFTFTETAAALGLLGSAGFQGQEAGVGLRRIMSNLVAPTSGQAKAMAFLELEMKNADGSVKSLVEVLAEFENAQRKGATESQIAAGALEIFGQRGGPQLLALLGQGSKALNKFTKELDENGSAARVAEAQMKGLPGAFKEVASAFEGLQLVFGESLFGELAEKGLRKLATGLRDLSKFMKNLTIDADDFTDALFTPFKVFTPLLEAAKLGLSTITGDGGATGPAVTAGTGVGQSALAASGGLSQTEVVIKVQAEPGTASTTESVKTKGGAKVGVENKSDVGPTMPNLTTFAFP